MKPGNMLRVSGVALGFVFFYSGGTILGWLVLPIVRLVSWGRVAGQQRCQRIVSGAFRLMLWYISTVGLYSIKAFAVDGSESRRLELDEPSVIIANHPSLLDIVLLKAKIGHGTIVVKPIYYYNPLLGFLPWCCGYIRGGSSVGRGVSVIGEAVDRLEEGSSVILFPEGTRSPDGDLLPFHRGAFRIAELSGAPLIPVWVTCEPRVLGRGQGLRGYPDHRVKLDAHRLGDAPSGFKVNDARADALEWENQYRDILADGGLRRSAR